MSRGDKAGIEDPLLQVCTEKDLTRIAKQVDKWKVEVLKLWKRKNGLQATFKVLADVFSKELNDQAMVVTIKSLATVAFEEPSEDWVIEHLWDFEQLGVDNLQAAISGCSHMITETYSETLAVAANERKKLEVIVTTLSHMVKQQLIVFLKDLKSEIIPCVRHDEEEQPISKLSVSKRDSASVAVRNVESVNTLQRTELSGVIKKFRLTVKNIKMHLEQCDVQDLVTYLNMSANDIPYFSDEVKKKLHKCITIKDLFVRLSNYISWCKRDVLRVLVEVSDCKAAVDELNNFEDWLDTSQSIIHYPIPQASSSICPDPDSDITMVAIKANKDLKEVTYKGVEQYRDTIAQVGGVSSKAFDLQAKNSGSSILYWLIPKNVVKLLEDNIRNNLDHLYKQGIVEILFDPNIVITTGSKLRVRSLSYLTKLPPERAEESGEFPLPLDEHIDKEAVVELAHQLKKDMLRRDEEIEVLQKEQDKMVQKLEQDKEIRDKEIQSLKMQLIQSNEEIIKLSKENVDLEQALEQQDTRSQFKTTHPQESGDVIEPEPWTLEWTLDFTLT